MVADGGATAHSGCVYGESDQDSRDRWEPSDIGS
jgi:hypothetical protein